jgi:hypothetical protein
MRTYTILKTIIKPDINMETEDKYGFEYDVPAKPKFKKLLKKIGGWIIVIVCVALYLLVYNWFDWNRQKEYYQRKQEMKMMNHGKKS